MTVRAMGRDATQKKKEKKKKETAAERRAREKREKEEKEAREKDAREAMAAERRGANAREAQAAGPKATKPPEKPASASEEDDDDDDDDGEQENEEGEEDNDEECLDLAVGDPACKVSQCGLSNATAKWNCPQHQKAARDQASNVDTEATRARRGRKEVNRGEGTSTWGPPPKKKKKQAKDMPVFDQKAAEQAMANAMALFMQQLHALAQLAQKVCPILTGYIR